MYRLVAVAVLLIFTGVNIALFSLSDSNMNIYIETGQKKLKISVELAETDEEQKYGLMNREKLREGNGMLFVYEEPLILSFWMKDVLIPLDMLFIGEDLNIKHIFHSASPCNEQVKCPTYPYLKPIQYVLEVPGGYAKKHKIEKGDSIEF